MANNALLEIESLIKTFDNASSSQSSMQNAIPSNYDEPEVEESMECALDPPNDDHIVNTPESQIIPLQNQLLLLSGYIRESSMQHSSNLFDLKAMNEITFDFYHQKIMRWYTKHHGSYLKFTSNSVRKIKETCQQSSCLFGEDDLNISEYDELRIKFGWYGKYLYMGYLTVPVDEYADIYEEYDDEYWDGFIVEYFVSVKVDIRNNKFILEENYDDEDKFLDGYIYKHDEQEIFEMVFDLKGREWIIYHNDKRAASFPIDSNQKTIHAGFDLGGWGNEQITILEYSLIKTYNK